MKISVADRDEIHKKAIAVEEHPYVDLQYFKLKVHNAPVYFAIVSLTFFGLVFLYIGLTNFDKVYTNIIDMLVVIGFIVLGIISMIQAMRSYKLLNSKSLLSPLIIGDGWFSNPFPDKIVRKLGVTNKFPVFKKISLGKFKKRKKYYLIANTRYTLKAGELIEKHVINNPKSEDLNLRDVFETYEEVEIE